MKTLTLITASLLTCLHLLGQTNFQGGIYNNTTWTKDKSPYIITGNVAVFPSKTLTIESGVEVRFNGNYYFEVRGKLITAGTSVMPVIFTSNLSNPKKNDWSGIVFNVDLGATSSCRYTNFSYANIANTINSSQVYYNALNGIQLNNCNFFSNDTAIYTPIKSNYLSIGTTKIDSCSFSNNYNAIKGNGWDISNSTFTNNINGIYESAMVYVKKSFFQFNSNCAIYAIDGAIDNCIIKNNNIGILNHYYAENTITNNIISENSIGLEFSKPIESSIFGYWHMPPKNNTISNNVIYNVENLSEKTKDLTGNYWGTSDSTTIEDKIKDGYDDITLGLINYDIYDNNGLKIKSVIKVDFTGLKETQFENIVKFYPTSVSSELNIVVKELQFKVLDIAIYNTRGQLVYSSKINSSNLKINLESIIPGIYIVVVKCDSHVIKKRIIKN